MKRLTPRYKHWLISRARNEIRRATRAHHSFATLATPAGIQLVRLSSGMAIPAELCLDSALSQTIEFFYGLRRRTMRIISGHLKRQTSRHRGRIGWMKAYTDFTTLRRVSPGAALILAAEYDRINRITGTLPNTIDLPLWDLTVYSTLYKLGFFQLLGFDSKMQDQQHLPEPQARGFLIMPMKSGNNVDLRDAAPAVIDLFQRAGGSVNLRVQLMGGVVDAIENVREHAYQDRTAFENSRIPPFWWLSGSVDQDHRRLTLSIYDQGLTIPKTLPIIWGSSVLEGFFRRIFSIPYDPADVAHDGEALHAAMQLSQTSTGEANRGKGLSKIREIVSKCVAGRLRVISRNGDYAYENGVGVWNICLSHCWVHTSS